MGIAVENNSSSQKKGRYPQDLKKETQDETLFTRDDGRQDWNEEEDSHREKPDDAEYITLEEIPPDSSKEKGGRSGYVDKIDEIFFSPAVPDGVVIPSDHGESEEKKADNTQDNGHDESRDQRQRPGDKDLPSQLQTRRR
jgi:hypothetical protein